MTHATATVKNENGIHCRPSAVIIKEVATLLAQMRVVAASGETDLRSIIGLLALGLGPGEPVEIFAEGPDETRAVATLRELFEREFDFPPRPAGQSVDQLMQEFES